MTYLPISINITDRKVLVVGGGRVALQKLRVLLQFTRQVSVVAREVSEDVAASGADIRVKAYETKDLDGVALVYACTNDRRLNALIREDARRKGVLVNVVDDPGLCDFITPALYRKDHMTVAVSSNGEDVKRSIRWRDRIRRLFDHDHPAE